MSENRLNVVGENPKEIQEIRKRAPSHQMPSCVVFLKRDEVKQSSEVIRQDLDKLALEHKFKGGSSGRLIEDRKCKLQRKDSPSKQPTKDNKEERQPSILRQESTNDNQMREKNERQIKNPLLFWNGKADAEEEEKETSRKKVGSFPEEMKVNNFQESTLSRTPNLPTRKPQLQNNVVSLMGIEELSELKEKESNNPSSRNHCSIKKTFLNAEKSYLGISSFSKSIEKSESLSSLINPKLDRIGEEQPQQSSDAPYFSQSRLNEKKLRVIGTQEIKLTEQKFYQVNILGKQASEESFQGLQSCPNHFKP